MSAFCLCLRGVPQPALLSAENTTPSAAVVYRQRFVDAAAAGLHRGDFRVKCAFGSKDRQRGHFFLVYLGIGAIQTLCTCEVKAEKVTAAGRERHLSSFAP